MNELKSVWQSKKIWANSVIIVLAALDALQLLPAVPPGWAPYILAAQGFLNVVLRLTTSSGIQGFAPQGDPMRAAPAPQAAPPGEAGAPSVAAIIARDNGLDLPEDQP